MSGPIYPRGFDDSWERNYSPRAGSKFSKTSSNSRVKLADKEFMVWDGEGVIHDGENEMSYVLFGFTAADGIQKYIYSRDLRSSTILEFTYERACEYKDFIHVSFGFSFDVDQITKDIPDDKLRELVSEGEIKWNGWEIGYIPRKMFRLKKVGKGNPRVTIFDVMSFFGTSMIKAASLYVPDHPLLAEVSIGKDKRGAFSYKELFSVIIPYWEKENLLMVETMNALRYSLNGAKIKLSSWHGPGAVANSLITGNRLATHIQTSREEMPTQVLEAAQFAFFGGRFENPIIGHINGPIYAYDIRSAYPAALAEMPGLSGGIWCHEYAPSNVDKWGVYRYNLKAQEFAGGILGMGPFPNRAPNGTVSYALSGTGWVYGHEIIAARLSGFEVEIFEGWEYHGSSTKPFIFTKELYVKRAQFKAAGNPAQLACKLGMNSVYGKLAQTVGWDEDTFLPPRYHHSWYAGQTTSWCRARILLAMAQKPAAIIACETDGIYSREPLSLAIGNHLGQWEESHYDEMYYIQSGFYFARKGTCANANCRHRYENDEDKGCAWEVAKVRGLTAGRDNDLSSVFAKCATLEEIETSVHRYGSLTGYIGKEKHYTWFDQPRTIQWGGNGKRFHDPDSCGCVSGRHKIESDGTHRTVMSRPFCGKSEPRILPWRENPELADALE